MRKIAELQAHPQNYRHHPDAQLEAIGKSLNKLGQYRPIIIRPDGTILAGHGVVAAAERLGWSEVEVTVFEGTDEQAKQLLVADNELSRMADDDTDVLISLLQEMEDVSAVGWSDDDLEKLIGEIYDDNEHVNDAGPGDVPDDPIVQLGDTWIFGDNDHILVCGDSRDKSIWPETGVVITDPPYGINFEYAKHKDTPDENAKLVSDVFSNARGGLVWTPGLMNIGRELLRYPDAKIAVWYKKFSNAGNGLGGANTWEPILIHQPPCKKLNNDVLTVQTDRVSVNETPLNDLHPCPKPVQLYVELIEAFSRKNVIDPFCGSGTTLIAAEKTGRKCYGIEIDPRYCDVIINRYIQATGKTVKKQ